MTMLTSIQETQRFASDDPRWARIVAPRSVGRRCVLVFGFNNRDLLPAIMPIPNRQSKKRAIVRHARRGESDRLPAMQAMQAGRKLT